MAEEIIPGGRWGNRTHCKQGHPLTAENTRWNKHQGRRCLPCMREQSKRGHAKLKEKVRNGEIDGRVTDENRAKILERFEKSVNKTDGCWLWTKVKDLHGYGKMSIKGLMRKAPRVSWELHNGEIPEGMSVCHRCDNPTCVRPDHLFLGTHEENMRDAFAKGRISTSTAVKASRKAFVARIKREGAVEALLRVREARDTDMVFNIDAELARLREEGE